MNKLEMAHEYIIEIIKKDGFQKQYVLEAIQLGWQYADEMQAEADKREKQRSIDDAESSKVFFEKLTGSLALQQTFIDGIEQPRYSDEQWQPDWSQAPEWANWWAMDKNKQGVWHNKMPCNKQSVAGWIIDFSAGSDFSYKLSPNFNYQGDWKDSLRKRP